MDARAPASAAPSAARPVAAAPARAVQEYSGILRPDPGGGIQQPGTGVGPGEVSIRIVAPGEAGTSSERAEEVIVEEEEEDGQATRTRPEDSSPAAGGGKGGRESSSSYQRYDIQQVARWVEQILPFSLLLLVVFIRQHLQGFFVTIWIAAVMFKSNDILCKQTALKIGDCFVELLRERKIPVLVGITILFVVHVSGFYWCYKNGDLIRPLMMLPPKEIPPFWHAIFIILVNDTMVRQTAMVVKCLLLMYYKNSRGRSYRRQGQMLTIVEYFLLLYRALLPTPVWYRFFLNKEYGSLFSSLTTGLYLTFKLTSVVEKIGKGWCVAAKERTSCFCARKKDAKDL
ncbi:RING finger and transmembrane domain-containing protein 2 [Zea mays]|uniref:RING finger and transmembrane domain-containing protein 2 n=1 Tax=Zea mays TaxID=4577 RepID=A0A3L6EY31_MAIZE|nr:RING finger and transmembrane domain-containing protein 2 [Zea mays]